MSAPPASGAAAANNASNANSDAANGGKPALTKAERRAQHLQQRPDHQPRAKLTGEEAKAAKEANRLRQEAQRLAKGQSRTGGAVGGNAAGAGSSGGGAAASSSGAATHAGGGGGGRARAGSVSEAAGQTARAPSTAAGSKHVDRTPAQRKVALFSHLKQYEREGSLTQRVGFHSTNPSSIEDIHPAIVVLGLRYSDGSIRGADARAVAFMQALGEVVEDFVVPVGAHYYDSLLKRCSIQFDFLTNCRTHSITMGNAFAFFKVCLSKLRSQVEEEEEGKAILLAAIKEYVRVHIVVATGVIVNAGVALLEAEGDVVLTFARSNLVEKVLLTAHHQGKKFKVVVTGSHPGREAVEFMKTLAAAGISCAFGSLSAVSHMLESERVTKVFLGAGALLGNGAVLARAGTASVALLAKQAMKPVLVFSEAYKFSEKVLLDSIVYNELADPDELLFPDSLDGQISSKDPIVDWRDEKNLKLLNLMYDVTPSNFIDLIVTELGNLPPSSVPVIVREREEQNKDLT